MMQALTDVIRLSTVACLREEDDGITDSTGEAALRVGGVRIRLCWLRYGTGATLWLLELSLPMSASS